jgi:hypothetical protein
MSSLPDSSQIALKEWAGVCDALMTGRQAIILRKGGILEDPGGFAPEHSFFWLYPTHVHQAEQGLRVDHGAVAASGSPPDATDRVMIQALAAVELVHFVGSEETLPWLTPFHVLTEETVRKRFHYRKPGLWVLGVRVFRRQEPWPLDPTPEQLGCKSWVVLDTPLATQGLKPVIDAADWAQRLDRLRSLVTSIPTGG